MNQKPIHVFAKWQVKDGHLDAVLSRLAEVVKKSTQEEGNLFYKVHKSNTDVNTLVLFEAYTDEAALETHRNSEYFQSIVIGEIVPMLQDREVTLATQLDLG